VEIKVCPLSVWSPDEDANVLFFTSS